MSDRRVRNERLSDAEKIFIVHGAQDGSRIDGRGLVDSVFLENRRLVSNSVQFNRLSCSATMFGFRRRGDFRPFRGVPATTDGSARVGIGGTDVLAGVEAGLV